MNSPYSSGFDPLTQHVVNMNEALQLRQSAERLVRESAQMFTEASQRTAGRRYSVTRVINATIIGGRLDGVERETSEELARMMARAHDPQKPWVPWAALAQRTLLATGTDSGLNIVASPAMPAVAALTPFSTLIRLGAAVFPGLVGNPLIPRVTTSGTASWLGETGTATAADPVLDQIAATPKRIVGYCEISKQLLMQAPMIADRMVSTNLLGIVGREIDKAMLSGTGTDEPVGILNTVGITKTTGTAFSHTNGQTMIKNAAAASVIDENIKALGAPTVRETLSLRGLNGTGAEAGYVWQNGKFCASVPAFVSANVPSGQLFVGDFAHTWLLMWNAGIQLEINPFAQFKSDIYGMKVVCHADVAVVQPAAYHVSTGIT
jgi:hypothetical protein